MKFLIQRVTKAQVDIDGQTVGKIDEKVIWCLLVWARATPKKWQTA